MNLVILHYHLNPGGVTKVIIDHLYALNKQNTIEKVLLLTGPTEVPKKLIEDSKDYNFEFKHEIIPTLEYSTSIDIAEKQYSQISQAITNNWKNDIPDVIHIHNHHLAKNIAILPTISKLSETKSKILLHIHDFPEDCRPLNFKKLKENLNKKNLNELMYPISLNIDYAVLNNRDKKILINSGINKNKVFLLPNVVAINKENTPKISELKPVLIKLLTKLKLDTNYKNLFTYPVRGIKRKNIGELILLSAISSKENIFAITLPPQNPEEYTNYKMWQEFSVKNKLPMIFSLGLEKGFTLNSIFKLSKAIITTSLCEGFGFSFCEPWLANKEVIGRDISDITSDFKKNKITFLNYYKSFRIPINILENNEFETKLKKSLRKYLEAYELKSNEININEFINFKIKNNTIDFGDLDIKLQQKVIKIVIESSKIKNEIILLNKSFLENSGIVTNKKKNKKNNLLIKDNKKIISNMYSFKKIGKTLVDVYQNCGKTSDKGLSINTKDILLKFLSPENYQLIRSSLE